MWTSKLLTGHVEKQCLYWPLSYVGSYFHNYADEKEVMSTGFNFR